MSTLRRIHMIFMLAAALLCSFGCAQPGTGGADPAVMMEDDKPAYNMDTPTRF